MEGVKRIVFASSITVGDGFRHIEPYKAIYDKRYAATCMNCGPDFVKLAEAYGGLGLRATKPEEVLPVLEKGLASTRTVIMDFVVAKEECVYPMVPAGAPITEMLLA